MRISGIRQKRGGCRMPTLEWIGKNKVVNHHLEVPYQVLQRVYSYDEKGQHPEDNGSENKIIHGDNLAALKSLLPQYEGKIKCIYIDPPYNTGNEGWVYNDTVNDPRIQKWLGEVVGKEGEDLSRHDKWLCMMYPRLRLLQKLLAEDGVIFISIDDNEQANLKLVCDEIFGAENFIAEAVWKRRASSAFANRHVSTDHEYILSYGKSMNTSFYGIKKDYKGYSNPDNDPRGPWTTGDLTVGMTNTMRPNQYYDLVDPRTKRIYKASKSRVWSYIPESMKKLIEDNRIVFPSDPNKKPMKKRFLSELKDLTNPMSTWITEVGLNSEGAKTIKEIFQDNVFQYSKPVTLIQFLAAQIMDKDSLILDSFAGSGTTAHAVLNLNQQDGGHRKFILIEMMDYADTITAERVKRVIHGYGEGKSAVPGTGGSFSYYELGQPIFHGDFLNEEIGLEEIRKYVYFTETRQTAEPIRPEEPAYLGKWMDTVYYFHYDRNAATTLNWDFLAKVRTKGESYVMYADRCTLSEEELQKYHITFKKIPRDIARF